MYESVAKLPCGEVTEAKLPCGEVTGNRDSDVIIETNKQTMEQRFDYGNLAGALDTALMKYVF